MGFTITITITCIGVTWRPKSLSVLHCTVVNVFWSFASRKYAYIILTPLKPHFYVVKLGFTGLQGYTLSFLVCLKKPKYSEYSLEPPRRVGSNEYPQYMF